MILPSNLTDCKCQDCSEGNCHIDVSGLENQVHIVWMDCIKDKLHRSGRICDCGIIWKQTAIIAAIELKGGRSNLRIQHLVRQLQGGLDALSELLSDQSVSDFYPVLLYRGNRDLTSSLAVNPVRFRGKQRRIIALPCGTSLSAVVGQRTAHTPRRRRGRPRRGSR